MPVTIYTDMSSCSDTSDISDDSPLSSDLHRHSRNDICRDYLRNVCNRGSRCKYRHPSKEESKSLGRAPLYTFCHDFQNSSCHRPNCKFMHCTREEEEYYKQTGQLPARLQQAAALGIGLLQTSKVPLQKGVVPICKDYLKGECKRAGRCKFRHLSRSQYETALKSNGSVISGGEPQEVSNSPPTGVEAATAQLIYAPTNHVHPQLNATANHIDYTQAASHHEAAAVDYETAAKRRRMELVPQAYANDYISSYAQSAFQPAAIAATGTAIATTNNGLAYGAVRSEENLYLRRRVEMLKKQVSDLMATNEVLLEQNARYRANKVNNNTVSSAPPIVTVSQVVTPTISPASISSLVQPTLTPLPSAQPLPGSGMSVLYEHKRAELITLTQPQQAAPAPQPQMLPPPTLAQLSQPPPSINSNQTQPTIATVATQEANNVMVPVSLTMGCITHPRSMPVSVATQMASGPPPILSAPPPPLTLECIAPVQPITAAPPPPRPQQPVVTVSMPQTSLSMSQSQPQLLASAHNPTATLVSYPLISHSQQIPTSSMG